MKKLCLYLLIGFATFGFWLTGDAQAGYEVSIVVDDHWWQSPENFGADLRAVILHNGTPIPNSTDYYYWWWLYFSHEGNWRVLRSGFGEHQVTPETRFSWNFCAYVVVTDSAHHTFSGLTSEEAGPFTAPGEIGENVFYRPLQQNGEPIGDVTWNHWRTTILQWRPGHNVLTRNENETVEATPLYNSSLGQKFRYWNGVETNVQNHNTFFISTSSNNLNPRYWGTQETVIIKTDLVDVPGMTGGTVEFHDPWYVDFQDGLYRNNWRNRGMVEPRQFHTRSVGSTGWQPDFSTVYPEGPYAYNGVFLNQTFSSGVFYSVGAPNPNTVAGFTSHFRNWEGTNVQY